MTESIPPGRILLAVTSPKSLRLLEGFGDYLNSLGWDVHIVSGPSVRSRLSDETVTRHEIPIEREPSFVKDVKSYFLLLKIIKRLKPDVVSAGAPKAALLGMLASFTARVPRRTYHLRGLRLESERGVRYQVLRSVERLVSSVATDVLAVSPSLREKAIELKIASSDKIVCLGHGSSNGVDLTTFHPRRIGCDEQRALRVANGLDIDTPVIGFVGRLTVSKGIYELAAVSRNLHDLGVPHQLLIIGSTEFDSSDTLWKESGLTGKHKPVILGSVRDVEKYYHLMDVLLHPTHREGMSNVTLEAAACGVPAVTTTATGARDAVVNGETGFLCSVGDVNSLTTAVRRILEDAEVRKRMSRNAVEFVQKFFEREKVWRLLGDYYQSGANPELSIADSE